MDNTNVIQSNWKQSAFFPNHEVSDLGEIRNTKTGKYLKPHTNKGGYKVVGIRKDGKRYFTQVHRLVWETFMGEIPDGMQIDHINTVRDDNRLENLRVVTPKQNAQNPITYQRKCKEGQRKHESEDFHETCRIAARKRSQDPVWKERNREALKRTRETEGYWENFYAVVHDENYRKKMSETLKEKYRNDAEFKQRWRDAMDILWKDPEFRRKNREHIRKSFGRAVQQIDMETGEVIREWECVSDAAKEVGTDVSSICKVCRGKQNYSKGYKWKYV